MRFDIVCNKGFFKKQVKYLATIEVSDDELYKHRVQRMSLIVKKLSEFILNNAKSDDVLAEYVDNIQDIYFISEKGLKVDLLNRA